MSHSVRSDEMQRRAARNPATSPEELRRLSYDEETSREVREALACNPSTPLDVLTELVAEVPAAFCRNPIAPLIPLEMPDFAEQVSLTGLAKMLRSPRAPAPLVQQIAESTGFLDYLSQTARWHVQYRSPIPEGEWFFAVQLFLWDSVYAVVQDKTKEDKKEVVVELAELGVIPQSLRSMVGECPVSSPEDYETFRRGLTRRQAKKLEQGYKNIPAKVRFQEEKQEEKDEVYLYLGASFNPAISDKTLMDWRIIDLLDLTLARNPHVSAKTLLRLSRHRNIEIRRAVLRNPSCPPEAQSLCRNAVLARILQESQYHFLETCSYYGTHPPRADPPWAFGRIVALLQAPDAIRRPHFRRFAASPLWEDRLAAALAINERPNGKSVKPKHRVLLEQLANDGNCLVRATAQARLRGELFTLEE